MDSSEDVPPEVVSSRGIIVAIRMRQQDGGDELNSATTNPNASTVLSSASPPSSHLPGVVWRYLKKINAIAQTTPQGEPLPERIVGRNFFPFDHYFGDDDSSGTREIYEAVCGGIVQNLMKGSNGTILEFGKRDGPDSCMHGSVGATSNGEDGIVQNCVRDIFDVIQEKEEREYLVRLSFIEIINEEVRDLLIPDVEGKEAMRRRASLLVREDVTADGTKGVFVNANEVMVHNCESFMDALCVGQSNRSIGTDKSSKSHTICRITVESRRNKNKESDNDDGAIIMATLNLVDLAGFQKEGGKRNQSLLTLSQVITKLGKTSTSSGTHINFRDSKLTRILQPHLAGNSHLGIICCATPCEKHLEETRSTLQFLLKAKSVKTCPKINQVLEGDNNNRSLIHKIEKKLLETRKQAELKSGESEHKNDVTNNKLAGENQMLRLKAVLLKGGKKGSEHNHSSDKKNTLLYNNETHEFESVALLGSHDNNCPASPSATVATKKKRRFTDLLSPKSVKQGAKEKEKDQSASQNCSVSQKQLETPVVKHTLDNSNDHTKQQVRSAKKAKFNVSTTSDHLQAVQMKSSSPQPTYTKSVSVVKTASDKKLEQDVKEINCLAHNDCVNDKKNVNIPSISINETATTASPTASPEERIATLLSEKSAAQQIIENLSLQKQLSDNDLHSLNANLEQFKVHLAKTEEEKKQLTCKIKSFEAIATEALKKELEKVTSTSEKHIEQLMITTKNLELKLEEVISEKNVVFEETNKLNRTIEEIVLKKSKAKDTIECLQCENKEMKIKINRVESATETQATTESNLKVAQEKITELSKNELVKVKLIADLTAERNNLSLQNKNVAQELKNVSGFKSITGKLIGELSRNTKDLELKLEAANSDKNALKEEKDIFGKKIEDLMTKRNETMNKIEELSRNTKDLEMKLEAANSDKNVLKEEKDIFGKKIEDLTMKKNETMNKIEHFASQNNDLNEQLNSISIERKSQVKECDELRRIHAVGIAAEEGINSRMKIAQDKISELLKKEMDREEVVANVTSDHSKLSLRNTNLKEELAKVSECNSKADTQVENLRNEVIKEKKTFYIKLEELIAERNEVDAKMKSLEFENKATAEELIRVTAARETLNKEKKELCDKYLYATNKRDSTIKITQEKNAELLANVVDREKMIGDLKLEQNNMSLQNENLQEEIKSTSGLKFAADNRIEQLMNDTDVMKMKLEEALSEKNSTMKGKNELDEIMKRVILEKDNAKTKIESLVSKNEEITEQLSKITAARKTSAKEYDALSGTHAGLILSKEETDSNLKASISQIETLNCQNSELLEEKQNMLDHTATLKSEADAKNGHFEMLISELTSERDNSHNKICELTTLEEKSKKLIARLSEEREELCLGNSSLETRAVELADEKKNDRKTIQMIQSNLDSCTREKDAALSRVDEVTSRIIHSETIIKDLKNSIDAIKEERAIEITKVECLTEEKKSVEEKISELISTKTYLDLSLSEVNSNNEECKRTIESLKNHISHLEECTSLNKSISEENNGLKQELTETKSKIENVYEKQLSSMKDELSSVEEVKDAANDALNKINEKYQVSAKKIIALQDEIEKMKIDLDKARNCIDESNTQNLIESKEKDNCTKKLVSFSTKDDVVCFTNVEEVKKEDGKNKSLLVEETSKVSNSSLCENIECDNSSPYNECADVMVCNNEILAKEKEEEEESEESECDTEVNIVLISDSDLDKMLVSDLKEELGKRGQSTAGKKKDLKRRLKKMVATEPICESI